MNFKSYNNPSPCLVDSLAVNFKNWAAITPRLKHSISMVFLITLDMFASACNHSSVYPIYLWINDWILFEDY